MGRCEAVNKWTPAIKIGMCQKFSDCCSPSDPQFGPFLDLNCSAQHCGSWPIPEDLNKGAETGSFLGYIKISRSWLVSKPGKQKMYRNVTQDLQWMTKWLSHVTLVPTFGHSDLGVQAKEGLGVPPCDTKRLPKPQPAFWLQDIWLLPIDSWEDLLLWSAVWNCTTTHNDSQRHARRWLVARSAMRYWQQWHQNLGLVETTQWLCQNAKWYSVPKRFWDRASRASCIKSSTQFSTTNNYQIISFESIIVVIQLLIAIVVLLYFIDGNHV